MVIMMIIIITIIIIISMTRPRSAGGGLRARRAGRARWSRGTPTRAPRQRDSCSECKPPETSSFCSFAIVNEAMTGLDTVLPTPRLAKGPTGRPKASDWRPRELCTRDWGCLCPSVEGTRLRSRRLQGAETSRPEATGAGAAAAARAGRRARESELGPARARGAVLARTGGWG